MLEKLNNAKPLKLQVWMISAGVAGLGLGAYLSDYIKQYALWIFLVSLAIHLVAMYKIYSRK